PLRCVVGGGWLGGHRDPRVIAAAAAVVIRMNRLELLQLEYSQPANAADRLARVTPRRRRQAGAGSRSFRRATSNSLPGGSAMSTITRFVLKHKLLVLLAWVGLAAAGAM